MDVSDLQSRFVDFAAGMPALAISRSLIFKNVDNVAQRLKGVYPDQPASVMANIPLHIKGLSFSAFLDGLTIEFQGKQVRLIPILRATVHPTDFPSQVIRDYTIRYPKPLVIGLDYNDSAKTLHWTINGSPSPKIVPSWGANADAALATSVLAAPQRDTFLKDVEIPILRKTSVNFSRLILDALPRYDLGDLCPWLTIMGLPRIDYDGNHILICPRQARVDLGGCSGGSKVIVPDPEFPYGEALGPVTVQSKVDLAIYLPKTRLIDFTATDIEAAILVRDGSDSGVVKWAAGGALGLKRLTVDISGGIKVGNPLKPGGLVIGGLLSLNVATDMVGYATAWIDGPSGSRLSLVTAGLIGDAEAAADIQVDLDLMSGILTLEGRVLSARADIQLDLSLPLPWPISIVTQEIAESTARTAVSKLSGQVVTHSRFQLFIIPKWLNDIVGNYEKFAPVVEAAPRLATHFGVQLAPVGKRKKGRKADAESRA